MGAGTLLDSIISVVIPRRCRICGRPAMREEKGICEQCLYTLPVSPSFRTPRQHLETARFFHNPPLVSANALLFYRRHNVVAELIKDFKYHSCSGLAERLGGLLAIHIKASADYLSVDCVMPVPIHFTKRMKRGYNQTEILARPVAEALDVPLSADLRAVRAHATQTHKNMKERQTGIKSDLFLVRHPERYRGKHILLLDDVITTGSTIRAAADAIFRDVPEAKISVLALAMTES